MSIFKVGKRGGGTLQKLHVSHFISLSLVNASPYPLFIFYLCTISRDGHQNLKLLLIDLNQMHLIGLVKRTILVFKSSKSDVSLQSYGL